MPKILLRLGLYPRRDPAGLAHIALPDPVAGWGLLLRGGEGGKMRGGEQGEEMEKGGGGARRGEEREGEE